MTTKHKCIGKTKAGKSCGKYPANGSDFCEVHKLQYNDDCPICISNIGKYGLVMEPCNHRIHLECLEGIISLECPICRTGIVNCPENIKIKINKNKEKYAEKLNQDDINTFIETQIRANNEDRLTPHVTTSRIECISAICALKAIRIPDHYIPTHVTITFYSENNIPLPQGTFFDAIMQTSIEKLNQDVFYSLDSDEIPSDDDSNNYDESEEDIPLFEINTELIKNLNNKITINIV